MNFVFLLPSYKGLAHNSTVLKKAIEKGFNTPAGCFYLANAGYRKASNKVLAPYLRTRYYLREFEKANQRPRTKEELFNLRHS